MNWSIFATILAQIEPPLMGAVDGMAGSLTGGVAQVLRWGVTLWVAGHMLAQVLSPAGNPLSEMERKLIRGAVGFAVATNLAAYNTYIKDVALSLPDGIGALVTGAVGGTALSGQAFDAVWNKAWAGGLTVYKTLGWSEVGLQILVVAYWFVALIAIGMGFIVWVTSKLVLYMLVGLGPLFAGMLVFPATRGWFQGWLNGVVTCVICQVLVVVLLVILTDTENKLIAQIVAAGAGGDQGMTSLQLLLGGVLLFFICGFIVSQLPGIASSIGHGASFHGAGVVASATGAASNAATAALAAVRGAVGAVAGAAKGAAGGGGKQHPRHVRPAGASLSGSGAAD